MTNSQQRSSVTAQFSSTVRVLTGEARRAGLAVPGFRSPPRLPGVSRSIRRLPSGSSVVAVAIRDRTSGDVLADLIEGIVACNSLDGEAAEATRERLRQAFPPAAAA